MVDLRAQLLDAGIELVADQGIGALAPHEVDARAGLAAGSTARWFPTRAEAARTPSLREFYAVGADTVDTWALDLVRRAGSRHPERDFSILANYVTGLVFHELALPTPGLDPVDRLRGVIDALQWSAQ